MNMSMTTTASTHVGPVRGSLSGDERGTGEGCRGENDVSGEHIRAIDGETE